MRIYPSDLSPEALDGVIESYVLREGTDYGHRAYTLEEKCAAVRRQIDAGEGQLWFDAQHQTVHLRHRDEPETRQ